MNYIRCLASPILIATALSGVTVLSAHASCENASPSSRLNPTELSDYGKCWLKKHRPQKQSGLAGDLFFVQAPNGDYFSIPVKTLAQMPEDKAIALVSNGVVEIIQQDVQEIGKVAAASQELENLRSKIDRKQERLKLLRQQSSDLQKEQRSLRAKRAALEAALTDEEAAPLPQLITGNEPQVEDPASPSAVEIQTPATEIGAPLLRTEGLPGQSSLLIEGTSTETVEATLPEEINQPEVDRRRDKAAEVAEIEERYALNLSEDEQKFEEIKSLERTVNERDDVIDLLRDTQNALEKTMAASKVKLNAEIESLKTDVKNLKAELEDVREERDKLIEAFSEKDGIQDSFQHKPDDEIRTEKGLTRKGDFETKNDKSLKAGEKGAVDIREEGSITTVASLNETPAYKSKAAITEVVTATPIEEKNSNTEPKFNTEPKLKLKEFDHDLVNNNASEVLTGADAEAFLNGEFQDAVVVTNPDLPSIAADDYMGDPAAALITAMGLTKDSEGNYNVENLVSANDTSNKVKLKTIHGIDLIFKNKGESDKFFAAIEASVEASVKSAVTKARDAYKQGYRDGYDAGYAQGFVDGYRQAEKDYGIGQ